MTPLVHYTLQLRPRLFVHVYLPMVLTVEDVDRLVAFVRTLVAETVEDVEVRS